MARLTERELDRIQQAYGTYWNIWGDMDDIMIKARRERARMFHSLVSQNRAAFTRLVNLDAIARFLSALLIQPVRNYVLRRRTLAELNRLDDRMLDDMGLARGDIARVVAELTAAPTVHSGAPEAAADQATRPGGPWSVTPPLAAATNRVRRWLDQRAAIRDLERLDDRLLADIGVNRADIAAVVKGLRTVRTERAASPAAEPLHYWDTVFRALRQWDLSRQAAGQMARLHRDTLDDLGYVKGDVDWVPEVLAQRRLREHKAA